MVGPVAAAMLLVGCTVNVGAAPSPSASDLPAPAAQTPTGQAPGGGSPRSATSATPTSATPVNRTWTHGLVAAATRPAAATSANVKGGGSYPNSTSLWVGCEGAPDEVTLAVNGQYKRLFGHLALREGVPSGLVVHTLILVDGSPVQNVQLDSGDPHAVEVNVVLTGVKQVTFSSEAVAGQCAASDESYAVLGDGYVE